MNLGQKLLGAGAVIMALCCAVLPVLGAAIGGGLVAGAGAVGLIVGLAVLAVVVALVARRRRSGSTC